MTTPDLVERLRGLASIALKAPMISAMSEAADALEAAHKRIAELEAALSRLERYVAMEAMDRLIEEGGRAVGWEKSHQFSALLDETRQILIPAPPSRIDKEDRNG